MKTPTIVILSGGLDSTVLAYSIANNHPRLSLAGCVSVNYGQRHSRELECAALTCSKLAVPHYLVDLSALGRVVHASALTGNQPVPEGHYESASMKDTVVPNRNMILIAVAAGVAISHGVHSLAYGAHAGDHAVYPDCRPEFAAAMDSVLTLCDYEPVIFNRPFIQLTKRNIVEIGAAIGVPFRDTHTCYKGGEVACGKCGTCVERLEAFEVALGSSSADPLAYEDRLYWREAVKSQPKQPKQGEFAK